MLPCGARLFRASVGQALQPPRAMIKKPKLAYLSKTRLAVILICFILALVGYYVAVTYP